jgi:two-component system chemotaxis response regulator CheB
MSSIQATNILANLPARSSMESPIRVLVVDDSVVMRQLITRMLTGEPDFDVVGTARNGNDAVKKTEQLKPNLITLDIEMPELDGLGALRIIKQRFPEIRVIMCSSLTECGAAVTMDALLAGADDYVTKAYSGEMAESAYNALKDSLIGKIRQLFRKRELASKGRTIPALRPDIPAAAPFQSSLVCLQSKPTPKVLAIGVSTGGPAALAEIVPMIPADFSLPIAIVQHMPPLFTQLLAERLTKISNLSVVEAKQGTRMQIGQAIVAPGNYHMRMVRRESDIRVELNQESHENSCRPAVDVLFRSIAEASGGSAIAVILTGMGQDGLLGVRVLKDLGASVIVQDSQTSVVWGMPGAVANAKLADMVLPLKEIVPAILRLI